MPYKKVHELVVNERMSQGERVKNPKVKKKVPGWSIEEMKERTNFAEEEDTEEMKRWRSLIQIGMDRCWKKLVERMEEEVLEYKVEESKRGAFKGRGNTLEWRTVRKNKRYKIRKWREDCWARIFLFVQRIQHAASAKQAGGVNRRGGDEAAAKDDNHERSDEEDQIERKDGCQEPMVRLGVACEGLLESVDPHKTGGYCAEMV